MAASHWRGWESGRCSVHEPWSFSSYNLMLKAGTGILREPLFFSLHWNSEEGRLWCQQKMVRATVQQMYSAWKEDKQPRQCRSSLNPLHCLFWVRVGVGIFSCGLILWGNKLTTLPFPRVFFLVDPKSNQTNTDWASRAANPLYNSCFCSYWIIFCPLNPSFYRLLRIRISKIFFFPQ